MAEIIGKTNDISFTVNILIKKEASLFVAHCLELDIVAAHKEKLCLWFVLKLIMPLPTII
jgi:hypothetical protein